MKNKSYFCDWYSKHEKWSLLFGLMIFAVCIGVACLIADRDFENKMEEGYYIYNEEGYQELEEIIDKCLIPYENIDLKTLRELTNNSCKITEGDESFKIIYSLPNQYGQSEGERITLTVTMSDDFLILSKDRNESYMGVQKFGIYFNYVIMAILVGLVILLVLFIIMESANAISQKRKAKREKK